MYNIGEQAVDLFYLEFPNVPPSILILGKTFFLVADCIVVILTYWTDP